MKARLVPASFAHEMVMLKKKELSFPSKFPGLLRSSPGTGSTQVPPKGSHSLATPLKELRCSSPLLSGGGAKAARRKLQ